MKIILGSESIGRKQVLEGMGYAFDVMPANIDEKAIRFEDPTELTLALANAKADALLPKINEPALLITSDQVIVCNGVIREKPVSKEEAGAFLESYAQYPAEAVTSVAVTNTATKERKTGTDVAKIWFNPIPAEVIQSYIETGDCFSNGGAFAYEHPLLAPYVKKVEGEGEVITGLPKKLTEEFIQYFNSSKTHE